MSDLTHWQQRVLDAIKAQPVISLHELISETELDEADVRRLVHELEQRSLIFAVSFGMGGNATYAATSDT